MNHAPSISMQDAASNAARPRMALAIATGFGLGYLPKAPGTWGSLLGVALAWTAVAATSSLPGAMWAPFLFVELTLALIASLAGVWAASRVASHLRLNDPQIVVIDEVAGQLIAYFGLVAAGTVVANWKYLLLGFILFRVFDIWKPFPARQAESLPSGLGIMADDWIAGGYAAVLLAFVTHFTR